MDKQSERVRWIESLRAFALLMVVIPHFIAGFCPEVFNVWETHSLFLKGISGKHGVAIFCVLLGFFSKIVFQLTLFVGICNLQSTLVLFFWCIQ